MRQSRLFRMNSVLLLHPEHTVMVDPGVLPSELDDLARVLEAVPALALTLVLTHADWDHVLGRSWWPEAMTIAHDHFAAELKRKAPSILEEARRAAQDAGERWEKGFEPFRPREALSGLRFSRLGPWRLVFRDAYGHSDSMLSIHLPEERLLIAADMLSDIEIPTLHRSCEDYRRTLTELIPLAEHGAIQTLIPGHGSIARDAGSALERLHRDLGYLDQLERGVEAARVSGLTLEQTQTRLSAMEFTGKMAEYSMLDHHRENVRIAYSGLPAAERPGSRPRVG